MFIRPKNGGRRLLCLSLLEHPCVSAIDPRTCRDVSLAGLFLCCQSCDDVAAGTESPAGADAGATRGTETLGLLAVSSGIDGACACACACAC